MPLRCEPVCNARIKTLVERGKLAQPYRTFAAFPGYLMVRVDAPPSIFWHRIRDCRHVRGIITNDGRPERLEDDQIEALASSMTCKVRFAADAWPIGEEVTITEGAFASLNGTVARGLRKESVQILVRMLGAMQRVEVPVRALAKVA